MKILENTSTHLTFKDTNLEIFIFRLGGSIFLLIGFLGALFSIFVIIISNEIYVGLLFMALAMSLPIIGGFFLLFYFPRKTIHFDKDLNKLIIRSESLLRKRSQEYAIGDIKQVTLEMEGIAKNKINSFNEKMNDLTRQSETLSREINYENTMSGAKKVTFDIDQLLENQSYSVLLNMGSNDKSIRLFTLKLKDAKKIANLIRNFLEIT